jgi:hypothetical protein
MNCFEPEFKFLTPYRGFNDYFQFHLFACNYVGISFHILGYGFKASIRVYNPSKRSKSDSNDLCEKKEGQV